MESKVHGGVTGRITSHPLQIKMSFIMDPLVFGIQPKLETMVILDFVYNFSFNLRNDGHKTKLHLPKAFRLYHT